MPINIATDQLLTFSAAAKLLPRRRRGRRVNVATLYRWSVRGCRGVRLETVQIGGTRCTSVEALQRFFEALSPRIVVPGGAPATGTHCQNGNDVSKDLAEEGLD
jgi:hypothetical protein